VSSRVSPVPPDALPSIAFPLKVSGPFFCGVLTSPDFCYHPPLPALPLPKKRDTKSTATRMSRHHSPIPMERAVSSYLEWQLHVDPSTLRDFNIAFSKISLRQTHLKPPPQTTCPRVDCARTTRRANCIFCACSNLFFFLFPLTLCAPPSTPGHPRASLHTLHLEFEAPTLLQVLMNSVVHTRHQITLPQPLPLPSLCCHCHATLARLSTCPH